jgi:hypothetical protein
MYNVLLILLHRPFVSDGHLHSNARSITVNSLLVCANAATAITQVLRIYHQAFSVRRAPYLIAYATYVSSTIHVRIAAKRTPGSDAHKSLATCLAVFRVNQETNWAARRARNIVESLARKLNVQLPDTSGALMLTNTEAPPNYPAVATPAHVEPQYYVHNDPSWQQGFSPTMDVDAIIQSFAREQDQPQVHMMEPMPVTSADMAQQQQLYGGGDGTFQGDGAGQGWIGGADFTFDDLLFGFNNSMLDNFNTTF